MIFSKSPEKQVASVRKQLQGLNRGEVFNDIIQNPSEVNIAALLGGVVIGGRGDFTYSGFITSVTDDVDEWAGENVPHIDCRVEYGVKRRAASGWLDVREGSFESVFHVGATNTYIGARRVHDLEHGIKIMNTGDNWSFVASFHASDGAMTPEALVDAVAAEQMARAI